MKIDSAWSVLLGAGLCMFCGQPAVVLFTYGIFAPAIAADTGWSAVAVAAAIAPATIAGALLAPAAGRAADAFGVRRVALIGGPAYAIGFILLAWLAHQLWAFIALLILVCALGFAATPVIYAQLTTGWFAKRRGLALSLMFSCTSLGVAFWPPAAARLIAAYDWRTSYIVLGTAAGATVFLSALLLLRDPPRPVTPPAAQARNHLPAAGLSLPDALRSTTFWQLAAIFMLLTGVLAGVTVNLPLVLQLEGVPPLAAASVMTVVGAAMFVGRLSAGVMLDRWPAPLVTAAFTLLPMIAFAALLAGSGIVSLYAAAALLGLGLGSEMDAAAYLVSRAFGLRSFGAIYGAVALTYGLSSAIGPATVGAALASGVSLEAIHVVCLTALAPALFLLLTLHDRHLPFGVRAASMHVDTQEQRDVR